MIITIIIIFIIHIQKLECRKDGQCQIDFATRKGCTKCRLEKCFKIGMKWMWKSGNKSSVRTSTSLVKIKDNNNNNISNNNIHDENNDGRQLQLEPIYKNINEDSMKSNNQVKSKSEMYLLLTQPSTLFPEIIDPNNNNNKNNFFVGSLSSLINMKRQRRFASNLTILERELIAELQTSIDECFEEEHKLIVIGEIDDFVQAINFPVLYVRRIVKFCKKISAFRQLTSDDQLIILKPFFIELLAVRFTYYFDIVNDGHYILKVKSKVVEMKVACISHKYMPLTYHLSFKN